MKMNLKKTNDFLEGQGTRLKVNLSQFPSFIFPTLELCKCGYFFFNVQKKQSNPEKQKNQLKQIIIVHQSGSITTQRKIILGDLILYL